MSTTAASLVTIAAMALVTFATRAAGVLFVRAANPGARLTRVLQAAPKTMFVALVTPPLAHGGPAKWAGAVTALAVMGASRNLLVAILAATVVVAVVRLQAG